MSDGITDGYRMSRIDPSDDTQEEHHVVEALSGTAIDSTNAYRVTFSDWVKKTEELKGDSFYNVSLQYRNWGLPDQITYLEAQAAWHDQITQPLASYLLEEHSEKITGHVNSMYELAMHIMQDRFPSKQFVEWEKLLRGGEFTPLFAQALEGMTRQEILTYLVSERNHYNTSHEELYKYVMENHSDLYKEHSTIQSVLLHLISR